MLSEVITIYAEYEPIVGVRNPSTHQKYRNPRLKIEKRNSSSLLHDEIRVEIEDTIINAKITQDEYKAKI